MAQLLALLVEVSSVAASGQQMKKPITGLVKSFSPKKQREPRAREAQTPSGATQESVAPPGSARDRAFKQGMSLLVSTSRGNAQ